MENTLEKLYRILLIPVLIAGIGLAGFVGYRYYQENKAVQVPDLSKMTVDEIYAWCGSLSTSYSCEIEMEKSRTVKENGLISQEPTAGAKLVDKVVIHISSGLIPQVSLPDLSDPLSLNQVKAWASDNRMDNVTYVEEENDKVENGYVIRIEPSQDVYADTPITVYISKNDPTIKPNDKGEIEIKAGQFIGETVERFESITRNSGLKPTHNTNRDAYSDAVEKGKIVSHGNGTYEKDEAITYGVSLGKKEGSSEDITVKQGAYTDISEDDFIAKAKELGLNPKHISDRDDYSDTIAKGKVLTHGFGTYEKNEDFNYGLSLGKKDDSSETDVILVKQNAYVDYSESEFIKKAKELGLNPKHVSDRDNYSDTVAKGNVLTHGYGTYEKNEDFNYGLSLGKNDGSSVVINEIIIKSNAYVGLSESDFIAKAKDLGLKAKHISDRDDYSDTVAKGNILTHGYGTYEPNEDFNYGLSLGKKDGSSASTEIIVKQNAYVGLSESSFIAKAKELGLNPKHLSDRDGYSDTIAKGNILTHGYGTYEKNEDFNYGLSLGKKGDTSTDEIKVTANQYVGNTVSDFESKMKALKLTPYHDTSTDAYSDSVAKGNIVWHGSGTYTAGERMRYGVSLGKQEITTINVGNYAGKNESELTSFLSQNGLVGKKTEQYSDTVASGKIISNDTGSKKKGDTVNYVVSKGAEPTTTIQLMPLKDFRATYSVTNDADKAVQNAKDFLKGKGFTNYEVEFATSRNYDKGTIISITVDGIPHSGAASYKSNAHIVVTVCSGYENG